MKLFYRSLLLVLVPIFALSLFAQPAHFDSSLHKTRAGKLFWYGADTSITGAPSPGFESLTGVPINHPNVACTSCHPGDNLDANGDPYPIPYPGGDCVDCHATNSGWTVDEAQCYDCHGRQKTEKIALGYGDVHRDASTPLKCWDCHTSGDMHGDGTRYNSMLEPGAIDVDCSDSGCHDNLPGGHAANDPHGGKLHCTSCHARTVISCYNCHFESQVLHHIKRAKQPIHDFVILVNRTSDGKVHPASFQSLTYQGNSWVAMAPYAAHTITKNEARVCTDCHQNFGGSVAAIQDYNADGIIKFTTWNSSDSTLSWLHGIVPLPENYERSFKMDFITFNGDPSSPPGSDNKNWSFVEGEWDGHQLFFATPLTAEQMAKIGMDTNWIALSVDEDPLPQVPQEFMLMQNYPNPFNPGTKIEFQLPHATTVSVKVYNILGKEVATLINGQNMTAGVHSVQFKAKNLSSGIYFYQLQTPEFTQTRKMFLLQ
ncbi:MAG: hypothetical protein Kow0042_04820 [Calditrichia bacterium]